MGQKLRENKVLFREKHPYPLLVVDSGEHAGSYELRPGTFTRDAKSGTYTLKVTTDGATTTITGIRGTTKYSAVHIHKMATWRTLTQFVEHLWKEWWRLRAASLERQSPRRTRKPRNVSAF